MDYHSMRRRRRSGPQDRELSRRHLLYLAGAGVLTAYLSGCGGGGGKAGTVASGGHDAAPLTVPTGSLSNQVEQYSKLVDGLSNSYSGQSPLLDEMSTTGRAAGTETDFFKGTAVGLGGGRAALGFLCRALAKLQDVAQFGDAVTTKLGLQGPAAINNPVWNIAMMAHMANGIRILGKFLIVQQGAGLAAFRTLVKNETDPVQRRIAYAALADRFNRWVTRLAASVSSPVFNGWLLSLDAGLTDAQIAAEVDRIPTIGQTLPFGLCLPQDSEDLFDALMVQSSFMGSIAEVYVDTANTAALNAWTRSPSFTPLANPGGADFTKPFIAKLITDIGGNAFRAGYEVKVRQGVANTAGPAARCAVITANNSYSIARILAGTIATPDSVYGSLVYGSGTDKSVTTLLDEFMQSVNDVEDAVPGRSVAALQSSRLSDGCYKQTRASRGFNPDCYLKPYPRNEICLLDNYAKELRCLFSTGGPNCANDNALPIPPVDVPARSVMGSETDQIRRFENTLNTQHVETNAQSDDPAAQKDIVNPGGDLIDSFTDTDLRNIRNLLAAHFGVVPPEERDNRGASRAPLPWRRTLVNLTNGNILLIYNYALANKDVLITLGQPGGFSNQQSDLALMIRRTAGATTVRVPAITSAQLLCTAPGFVPKRNTAPMDLTSATLEDLRPLAELGTGVQADVN